MFTQSFTSPGDYASSLPILPDFALPNIKAIAELVFFMQRSKERARRMHTKELHPCVGRYWGKAHPLEDAKAEFHPLAYHCLDVAAVGDALVTVRPALLDALVVCSGLPRELARQWLLLSLALHDVGKFADCFQCKVEKLYTPRPFAAGTPGKDPGHGAVGLRLWVENASIGTLPENGGFFALFDDESAANGFVRWMEAACGHHGRPVNSEFGHLEQRISIESLADVRAYIDACMQLFPVTIGGASGASAPKYSEARLTGACWLLAGIAILCDWIGSNQTWFCYEPPEHDLEDYWQLARTKAVNALTKAGIAAPAIATKFTLENALPGFVGSPSAPLAASPLQAWALENLEVCGPSLIFIEDLTGAGKTEAALIAAHRLMRAGIAEGLYWALPTMATANALYQRLARSYRALFDDAASASLVLAHGKRQFNETFRASIIEPGAQPAETYDTGNHRDEDQPASAQCAAWIADDRRKALLAEVGVGTIDQALLAILPVKHQALRLAALARRVFVVDEAHSLDEYSLRLLEALIRAQATFGGSVIVLSATLTKAARQRLTTAYAAGAGLRNAGVTSDAYPLVTQLDAKRLREQPCVASRGTRRDLPVERLDHPDQAVAALVEGHANGQAAVWIRNTVQDVIDAYERVRAQLPAEDVEIFHARFALGDRIEREQRILNYFGQQRVPQPRRRILIASQVIEQSLDLDFDVMITDLAPIDLIIQRAGRLHRHGRGHRPPPRLMVLGPPADPDAKADWYAKMFPIAQYVYPDVGWLWLTMQALEVHGLNLASESPRALIERVFASSEEDIPEGLRKVSGKAFGKRHAEAALAGMNVLDLKLGFVLNGGAWESETRTPTRLGDAQRVVRLARWINGRIEPWCPDADRATAWRLSEVQLRAARVQDYAPKSAAIAKACATEVAQWSERFDPPLLMALVETEGQWAAAESAGDARVRLWYSSETGAAFVAASLHRQG